MAVRSLALSGVGAMSSDALKSQAGNKSDPLKSQALPGVRFRGVNQDELREELKRFQEELVERLLRDVVDLRIAPVEGATREAMPESLLSKTVGFAPPRHERRLKTSRFEAVLDGRLCGTTHFEAVSHEGGGARPPGKECTQAERTFAYGASGMLKRHREVGHTHGDLSQHFAPGEGAPKLTRQARQKLTLGRGLLLAEHETRSPNPSPDPEEAPGGDVPARPSASEGYRPLRETTEISVVSAENPIGSQMPLLQENTASSAEWAHWDNSPEPGSSPPMTNRSSVHHSPRPLLPHSEAHMRDSLEIPHFDVKVDVLLQGPWAELVKHPAFNVVVGVMVALSSTQVGFEANWEIRRPGDDLAPLDKTVGLFFCAVFLIEQGIRIMAYGSLANFWNRTVRAWNAFDLSVVLAQVLYHLLEADLLDLPTRIEKVLRITAIGRVFRIFRMFHIFHNSEVIMNSILHSMWHFSWGIMVCVTLMYAFSVLLIECVVEYEITDANAHLLYWFGGLPRTLLTLLEAVMGGVSWDEVVHPLIEEVSPAVGILFCTYVVIGFFALLNVVSGIFSEGVTRMVREDKDNGKAALIRDHFLDGELHCDRKRFKRKMKSETMVQYLESLGLVSTDVDSFFDLLDSDGDGLVNSDEIVKGCLELRGPAKALNLTLLTRTVDEVLSKVELLITVFLVGDDELDEPGGRLSLRSDQSRFSTMSEDIFERDNSL